MPFTYTRTVRFQDTDAAGVVYFANVLNFCHEAYEESLRAGGIDVAEFFRGMPIAVPIVHTEVEFRQPLVCGQQVQIQLQPMLLTPDSFQIRYELFAETNPKPAAIASTRHVCIQPEPRQRCPLPESLRQWLEYIHTDPAQ